MKLLLDENLPHQMRLEIAGHEVFTAAYMGWSGIQNGALLQLAAENQYDVLITTDWGLEYEQNLDSLPIAIIVLLLETNTIDSIRLLYDDLQAALSIIQPRRLVKIGTA